MKKKVLKTTIEVYQSELELSASDQQLMRSAKKALKKAYAPYSNFKVGAAVLLENGKVIVGSNQENAAYPTCLCAERAALASCAGKYPKVPVVAIAITASAYQKKTDTPVSPCGTCRQYISEVEYRYDRKIRLIMQGEEGPVFIAPSGRSLLPLSFDGSFL